MFDAYVMVDWSAAAVPRTGRDSIWICWHAQAGERLVNPPTRHAARRLIGDWLATASAQGDRVLLGFDFPFGYPAGFAARLGLSAPPWRGVWDEIARLLRDDEHNANNRFEVAATFNERISGGRFPFWGCPAGLPRECLGAKHHRSHTAGGLAERRLIDEYMPGAQPCWKLLGAGSVGGQILTGLPVVRALRDDPRWRERARVWPFETGLRAPADGQVVMAEVYPSLWAVSAADGEPKDAAQVRAVARFFAEHDRAGKLAGLFAGDPRLTRGERDRVEAEEAWTLGVTTANQRPLRVPQIATTPAPAAVDPSARRGAQRPVRSGSRLRRAAAKGDGSGIPACGAAGGSNRAPPHAYLRDPVEISRRSFALIGQEADPARLPPSIRPLAIRLAHACGEASILADLAWSHGSVAAGRKALAAGGPVLADCTMVAAGIARPPLTAGNAVICTLRDPETAALAAAQRTTRSAAAVDLWRPHLAGAIVAIGNAPTALFRLLELLADGAPRPALVLGFPVGFVGAADAKAALAAFGDGLAFITLHGRRGGSPLAAAAVNALANIA